MSKAVTAKEGKRDDCHFKQCGEGWGVMAISLFLSNTFFFGYDVNDSGTGTLPRSSSSSL